MLIYAYINLAKVGVVILKKAKTSIVEGVDDCKKNEYKQKNECPKISLLK